MPNDLISTRAATDEGRLFWIGSLTISEPADGIVLDLGSFSPFNYEIVTLNHRTATGTIDVKIHNSTNAPNTEVDFAGANGDKSVTAAAGAIQTFAVSGDSVNYTVNRDNKLSLELLNAQSTPTDYVIQVTCRKAQENAVL